ncbi:MAG: hypothetical protein K0U39_01965 [Alphaproteobacteria bacterium]|nr:hypothetical protein [Alphaproteobacteria bacterium]
MLNRYLIFYDADSPREKLANELKRLQQLYPEPQHFVVNNNMLMVKSPYPLGRFIEMTGFTDGSAMNGFVIHIHNINGWYTTRLWDWYYSKD